MIIPDFSSLVSSLDLGELIAAIFSVSLLVIGRWFVVSGADVLINFIERVLR